VDAAATKPPESDSSDQENLFEGLFSKDLDDPEEASPLGVPRSLVMALQSTAMQAAESSSRSSSPSHGIPPDAEELPEVPTEVASRPSDSDPCGRPPIYAVPFDPGEVFDPLGPTGSRLSPSQLGLAPHVLPPSSLPARCMCKACRLSRESCDPSALQAEFQRLELPSGDVASAERWKVVRRAGPRASFRRAILRIRCDIKELRSTTGLGQLAQLNTWQGF